MTRINRVFSEEFGKIRIFNFRKPLRQLIFWEPAVTHSKKKTTRRTIGRKNKKGLSKKRNELQRKRRITYKRRQSNVKQIMGGVGGEVAKVAAQAVEKEAAQAVEKEAEKEAAQAVEKEAAQAVEKEAEKEAAHLAGKKGAHLAETDTKIIEKTETQRVDGLKKATSEAEYQGVSNPQSTTQPASSSQASGGNNDDDDDEINELVADYQKEFLEKLTARLSEMTKEVFDRFLTSIQTVMDKHSESITQSLMGSMNAVIRQKINPNGPYRAFIESIVKQNEFLIRGALENALLVLKTPHDFANDTFVSELLEQTIIQLSTPLKI